MRTTMTSLLLAFAATTFAEESDPELEPGQEKIKQLSPMVGDWVVTNNEGEQSSMSVCWINNKSFLELVSGNYREITRWDLVEKRFVTNAFGMFGGHGRLAWSRINENSWRLEGAPSYYWSSGEPAESNITVTLVDKDTMTYVGSIGDMKLNNTARRRQPKPEPALSKTWRKFWIGDWHRVTEWTIDGKTTKSEYDWSCKASGDANVSFGTTGKGYAATYAWQPDRAALVEVGHSSDADWEIVFRPVDEQTILGTSTGRTSDGRRGVGTNTIKRIGPNTYTAEAEVKFEDGSTLHVVDRNIRRSQGGEISFGKP